MSEKGAAETEKFSQLPAMIDATESAPTPAVAARRSSAAPAARSTKPTAKAAKKSAHLTRIFSDAKVKPFDQIEWDKRTAEITDDSGKTIFKQEGVEVPKSWSLLATKVVCSKYFYGDPAKSEREKSVKQLIHRVTRTIADWGVKDGYFSKADGEVFYDELTWLCVNQYGAFNSPVWFNVGLYHQYGVGKTSGKGNWFVNRKTSLAERAATQYEYPQGSACFIQTVNDDMESIMNLAYAEAMLFKHGSGTGTDLTPIRSSREKLSGGGKPSGRCSHSSNMPSAKPAMRQTGSKAVGRTFRSFTSLSKAFKWRCSCSAICWMVWTLAAAPLRCLSTAIWPS